MGDKKLGIGWREDVPNLINRQIENILIVLDHRCRDHSVLASSAIALLHFNFPGVQIDVVGVLASAKYFENVPIRYFYNIDPGIKGFFSACIVLLRTVRKNRYDLAIDVNHSRYNLGSTVVKLSGARCRFEFMGRTRGDCGTPSAFSYNAVIKKVQTYLK